jgi:hypothetical protein
MRCKFRCGMEWEGRCNEEGLGRLWAALSNFSSRERAVLATSLLIFWDFGPDSESTNLLTINRVESSTKGRFFKIILWSALSWIPSLNDQMGFFPAGWFLIVSGSLLLKVLWFQHQYKKTDHEWANDSTEREFEGKGNWWRGKIRSTHFQISILRKYRNWIPSLPIQWTYVSKPRTIHPAEFILILHVPASQCQQ